MAYSSSIVFIIPHNNTNIFSDSFQSIYNLSLRVSPLNTQANNFSEMAMHFLHDHVIEILS